ncbi:MAG: hypothetical protein FWD14_08805 [Treponema sp.]|nr:hypothetical protein [Treponema sp.]
MKKLGVVLMVLMLFSIGSLYADSDMAADATHFITGELSFVGAGIHYEYMITPKLGVGARAYVDGGIFTSTQGYFATVSFYPLKGVFFIGANAGWRIITIFPDTDWETSAGGFTFAPEVGWKIDLGKPGGIYFKPGIRLPLTYMGKSEVEKTDGTKEEVASFWPGFTPYIGFGWMF